MDNFDRSEFYIDEDFGLFKCQKDKSPETGLLWKNSKNHMTLKQATAYADAGNIVGAAIPKGVIVLDVDKKTDGGHKEDGEKPFKDLLSALGLGSIDNTFIVKTASGGWHYYFYYEGASPGVLTTGVDIKKNGGYVISATTAGYQAINDNDIIELPESLEIYISELKTEDKKREEVSVEAPFPLDRFKEMLCFIPAEKFDSNDAWFNFCASAVTLCGNSDGVINTLEEWSRKDRQYGADKSIRPRLLSLVPGKGIGIGTFINLIKPFKNAYALYRKERPAEKKEEPKEEMKEGLPFDPLGFDGDTYYFRSGRTGIIHEIGKNQFDQKHLLPLTRYMWFYDSYGVENEKTGKIMIPWSIVADDLMHKCEKKGTYSKKNVRGRGVWKDDEKIIVFDGEYIYENGTKHKMLSYTSKYCYERMERIDLFPKSDEFDLREIDNFIKPLKSSHPGQLKYLVGWCVIAPLCGVLYWRPHLWVHGLSGSGKTTVMEHIASQLLKGISIEATGKSTEAGIRQKVGNDARCVIVDDVKKNGADDHTKIEKLLDFMRTTSSDTEATTLMGSASQKVIERSTKTIFMLSSVNEQADATEDKNRITPVEMVKKDNMPKAKYNEHVRGIKKKMRAGMNKYFIKSVMTNVSTIMQNIDVFEEVLSVVVDSSRDADQLAPLIAGYYHIMNEGKIVNKTEAAKFIKQFDHNQQSARTEVKEHDKMFTALMIKRIRFSDPTGFTSERTVASLLETVMEKYRTKDEHWESCAEHKILREYGFRYNYKNHEEKLLIVCSHQRVKEELAKINLDRNYSTTLKTHALFNDFATSVRVTPGDDPKRCLIFDIHKLLGPEADEHFDEKYLSDNQIDKIPF